MIIYRILGKKGRVTIPFEIRRRLGFKYNDVLSFTESKDSKSVIVKREKICNGCKECNTDKTDEITLYDFLNNLTPEQQRAALVHLSVKWAERESVVKE